MIRRVVDYLSIVLVFSSLLLFHPGFAAGTKEFAVTRASWDSAKRELRVEGTGPGGVAVTIRDAASRSALGTVTIRSEGRWTFRKASPPSVPCRVAAEVQETVLERSVDKAPADCGPTAPALTSVAVSGPATVAESSTAAYAATASFSDGTTTVVTSTASWAENSGFASVAGGVVTTSAVTGNQSLTLSATYTSGGATRTGTLAVTILDATVPTGSHAGRFSVFEGTRTCLTCHTSEATAMHASAHYQWKGDATEAEGLDSPIAGKLGGINDFCIYPDINWIGKLTNVDGKVVDGGCARCHTGLGAKPTPEVSPAQLENIDCLLCHSRPYKRTVATVDGATRFVPDTANMSVSLLEAAADITLPDKNTCLNCHTKAGGGNNFKRGDLEEAHRNATPGFDVHLAPRSAGGAGLECTSCHVASGHRIAGRGIDLRERDTPTTVACSSCHGSAPHDSADVNKHTARVNCTVCHIPSYAKVAPTDMVRDWSKPGDLNPDTRLYEPNMVLASNLTPAYGFWNGRSRFYQFGSAAVPQANGRILMAGPLGSVGEPGSKIQAMKVHQGVQPIDPVSRRLLPLKIGIFFQTGDVANAVVQGAAGVGWPYNGYEFAATERYMGLFHEVAPSEQALGCTSCHNGGTRMNFAALGYTPKAVRNGKPLCASCHSAKSGNFNFVHTKHVTDKRIDCIECHSFSKAS